MLERIEYEGIPKAVGPYSHAVKHNGLLYLSGMTAFATPQQHGSLDQQAKAIFAQIGVILKQENIDFKHLIRVRLYVTDTTDLSKLRETLFSVYNGSLPASTLVYVSSLFDPSLLIEIESDFML